MQKVNRNNTGGKEVEVEHTSRQLLDRRTCSMARRVRRISGAADGSAIPLNVHCNEKRGVHTSRQLPERRTCSVARRVRRVSSVAGCAASDSP